MPTFFSRSITRLDNPCPFKSILRGIRVLQRSLKHYQLPAPIQSVHPSAAFWNGVLNRAEASRKVDNDADTNYLP